LSELIAGLEEAKVGQVIAKAALADLKSAPVQKQPRHQTPNNA